MNAKSLSGADDHKRSRRRSNRLIPFRRTNRAQVYSSLAATIRNMAPNITIEPVDENQSNEDRSNENDQISLHNGANFDNNFHESGEAPSYEHSIDPSSNYDNEEPNVEISLANISSDLSSSDFNNEEQLEQGIIFLTLAN